MARRASRLLLGLALLVATSILGLVVVGALHRPNTDIPPGFSGRHLDLSGLPVRVLQTGTGRDVLLIHGSPGSIEDWAPVRAALGESFRVTAFDRPGHGYSGSSGEYSFDHNAEVALRVIEQLKLERVVVVGHSYGGTTALAMALRRPAAVDAYVVVDSATYEPSRLPSAVLRLIDVPLLGLGIASTLGAARAPALIREGLNQQFASRVAPEDFVVLRTRIWSTPKVTRSIARETIDFGANLAALSPRYPSIRASVFILGQADDPFRRASAERLHRDVPGASLELLAGTGHYIQFEKTADVVRVIRRAASSTLTPSVEPGRVP